MTKTISKVAMAVSSVSGVSLEQMKSKSRILHCTFARMAVARIAAHSNGGMYSLKAIGEYLGGRHHSTVYHMVRGTFDPEVTQIEIEARRILDSQTTHNSQLHKNQQKGTTLCER